MPPEPAPRAPTALTDPDTGTIIFIASCRPPLPDGDYRLTVTQSASNIAKAPPPGATFDESYVNIRRFVVRGERFAVQQAEIGGVFPPSASTGEYGNVLPHVVIDRATLPWERSAGDAADSSWLALLLFDESDPVPPTLTIQVGDLTAAPFAHAEGATPTASTLPANTLSYPNLTLGYGEFPWQQCNAIDIPVALFRAVAPGVVDLPWLSHARTITPADPTRMGLAMVAGVPVETSVVLGNRLPQPNARCTVHLVSIENMAPLLATGDSYTSVPIVLPGGGDAAFVRLVSLANWSYRSVDPKQSFTEILKGLDAADDFRVLGIANASTDPTVANALAMGHVPLDHQTRQGSRTVSWYRGPLIPFAPPGTIVVPQPNATNDGLATADQALRYDPDTGMIDLTYAAAWEIGRLLALQDSEFARALYDWKRSNTQAVVEAFERGVLEQQMGEALGIDAVGLAAPQPMQHAIASFIVRRLAPHLTGKGTER